MEEDITPQMISIRLDEDSPTTSTDVMPTTVDFRSGALVPQDAGTTIPRSLHFTKDQPNTPMKMAYRTMMQAYLQHTSSLDAMTPLGLSLGGALIFPPVGDYF